MFATEFATEKDAQAFDDAVLDQLDSFTDPYTVRGEAVRGQSISYLHQQLRRRRSRTRPSTGGHTFSNLGTLYEFQLTLEERGFTVAEGRNSRNQRTTVVYI